MLKKYGWAAVRLTIVLGVPFAVLWWFGMRVPGKNCAGAAALTAEEVKLREELRADVQKLAGEIGERNLHRYPQLVAAAEFIEASLGRAGVTTQRESYEHHNLACHNIVAEIKGTGPGVVVIGGHYDSVVGCPGANDNGTGVAATIALARRFAGRSTARALRFVAFVNEEPPYFQTPAMGSNVYAARCRERGEDITAMISLETIGYFSDVPHSQRYPAPGLGAVYPSTGNFISFVANLPSKKLLHRVISTFRAQQKLPSEGAAMPAFIPGVGWSDQWSFWQHDYPGIMVTDTAPFRYPYYHEPGDTPDKLDYDRFALVVSGLEEVVKDLANRP